jgi:hypothetical protein
VKARLELLLRFLDLLGGIAGSERPQHRDALAYGTAEQLHGGNTKVLADRVEEHAFDRGLRGVVALCRPVHMNARRLEPIRRSSDQRRREVGVDRGLDALDALLAQARAAERCGLADGLDAIGQSAARQ